MYKKVKADMAVNFMKPSDSKNCLDCPKACKIIQLSIVTGQFTRKEVTASGPHNIY